MYHRNKSRYIETVPVYTNSFKNDCKSTFRTYIFNNRYHRPDDDRGNKLNAVLFSAARLVHYTIITVINIHHTSSYICAVVLSGRFVVVFQLSTQRGCD